MFFYEVEVLIGTDTFTARVPVMQKPQVHRGSVNRSAETPSVGAYLSNASYESYQSASGKIFARLDHPFYALSLDSF